MNNLNGEQLIQNLLTNPIKFNKEGKAYQLLQKYFDEMPLETLRPLLKNSDVEVNRAAVWIASELGRDANEIFDDVLPLVNSNDRYIKYHALEIIMVCSFEEKSEEIVHVIKALSSNDEVIRILAMRLISNASESQLQASVRIFEENASSDKHHLQGLLTLLDRNNITYEALLQMIDDSNPLTRKYGVIAAKRSLNKFSDAIKYAADSTDIDVRKFAEEVIEMSGS